MINWSNYLKVYTDQWWMHWWLKDAVFKIDTSGDKIIYLTFDDGPTQELSPFILEQLDLFNAKATFFCVGQNIENHPELFKLTSSNGHLCANHSFNHLNGFETEDIEYINNVDLASKYLDNKLYRPPYGKIKLNQLYDLQKEGYKIIMWSLLLYDWDQTINIEETKNIIQNNINPGMIIVLHDNIKATENLRILLPYLLEEGKKRGYRFEVLPV